MTEERYIQPDSDAQPTQRWVFIERESLGQKNMFLGPFDNDDDACTCMNESLLVQSELDPPIGGTDCFVTVEQPDLERDDVVLIDHNNPDHTGNPKAK